CRVQGFIAPEWSCPEEQGWLDPIDGDGNRRSLVEGEPPERYRVCDVRQLSGDALASCRNDVSCEGCEPGWCWRAPSETEGWDWRAQRCDSKDGWEWSQVRLVHGASSAVPGTLTLTCDLQEMMRPALP